MKITTLHLFWVLICFILFGSLESTAQESTQELDDRGYLAQYQSIVDLKSTFTLMSVAAHPDDEDVETLTYYRRKLGVQTVVVVATRGEGGQNEIGPELYRELGVIRTYEMWRAGAISGATYYNLNLEEFGYSKSAEETFEHWGHEKPLRRLVYLIRKLRPDVIITNHDTETGHGNHQATGILIREAFDIAGDPSRFPEQLQDGLQAWQPKRLFQRWSDPATADVALPTGDYDLIRGESYAETAARALSQHRSQGMEIFARKIKRGPRLTYYKLIKSAKDETVKGDDLFKGLPDLFQQLKTSLSKFASDEIEKLAAARKHSIRTFYESPQRLKTALKSELNLWRSVKNKIEPTSLFYPRILREEKKVENALQHTLGVDFKLVLDDTQVVQGQKLTADAVFFNGGQETVNLKSIRLIPRKDWLHLEDQFQYVNRTFTYNQQDTIRFEPTIPSNAPWTVPKTEVFYQSYQWQPLFSAEAEYDFAGVLLHAPTSVDLDIVPEIDLQLKPEHSIVPLSFRGWNKEIVVHVVNHTPRSISGEITLQWVKSLSSNDSSNRLRQSFLLNREDEATAVKFSLKIPEDFKPGDYPFQVQSRVRSVSGRPITLVRKGLVRLIDVKVVPDLKVGIVQSYDNTLVNALTQLGVETHLLSSEDLRWGDLSQYDTIILDIRAYLVREDLRQNNSRILEYVRQGGNLLVMYHKVYEWNPEYGNPSWAPFRLILTHNRVTREDAPVQILQPEHPLFNFPNKITKRDWQGWIQERGLYFPGEWDAHYTPLLAMSDPGELPLKGSLLVAHYGKGTYIYTSLVWYRQLRALVPGSYRMLANMISLGKAP